MMRPLFSRRDEESERIVVVDHHAIRSQVDPAFIRIDRDVHRASADVASARRVSCHFGLGELKTCQYLCPRSRFP